MSEVYPLGAHYEKQDRCSFNVWAPAAEKVSLHLVAPEERIVPLERTSDGYHCGLVQGVRPGARYFYRLNVGVERPDPASACQPAGVHGPSEVCDPTFPWTDSNWTGLPLREYILYELHVGSFSEAGTFEAALEHLPGLKDLGITAVELMPVAQFPGARNWGYDGVDLFAVQNSYGGPSGLKKFVDACHRLNLAVVLDVVYNHLGPEGNYLKEFGPYFSDSYKTAWGPSLNFDGPDCHQVRRFFRENALRWHEEFHVDALRLDAIHAIKDFSAVPFLQELAGAARLQAERLNRSFYLIAESDLNDSRIISDPECGGFGLDAQWSDDFHHALHVLLTGEQSGYYEDFEGVDPLARAFSQGYAFTGQFSRHRRRPHGNSPARNGPKQFVVYSQNHDQIGNRLRGDRLSTTLSFDQRKLAAGAVLLSPFLPMLFMGEEYGETAPFQYFVSHSDPALIDAVRKGRREEFAAFQWKEQAPDPQSEETFAACKLNRLLLNQPENRALLEFYRELIRIRRSFPILLTVPKSGISTVQPAERSMLVVYGDGKSKFALALNFGGEKLELPLDVFPAGAWTPVVNSADPRWGGEGTLPMADFANHLSGTLTLLPHSMVGLSG